MSDYDSSLDTYHEDDGPSRDKIPTETLVDDPLGCVDIESGQNVIEKYEIGARVDRTSEGDACLLATATTTADERLIIKEMPYTRT